MKIFKKSYFQFTYFDKLFSWFGWKCSIKVQILRNVLLSRIWWQKKFSQCSMYSLCLFYSQFWLTMIQWYFLSKLLQIVPYGHLQANSHGFFSLFHPPSLLLSQLVANICWFFWAWTNILTFVTQKMQQNISQWQKSKDTLFSLMYSPHFLEMEYGTVILKSWACSPIYQYGYLTGFKLLFRWILPSLCLIFTNLSVNRKVNFVILNEEKWVHLRGYFHIGPILERIIEEQDIYLLRLTTF